MVGPTISCEGAPAGGSNTQDLGPSPTTHIRTQLTLLGIIQSYVVFRMWRLLLPIAAGACHSLLPASDANRTMLHLLFALKGVSSHLADC
jgi:hypothetical protein